MKNRCLLNMLVFFLFGALTAYSRDLPYFSDNNPEDNPDKITFIYGQNLLEIGPDKLRIDLTGLGASFFDEKTIEMPVFVPDENWVHFILNPEWHGVLMLWEKDTAAEIGSRAKYMIIHAGDESKILPATAIKDEAGVFAVATRKGIMVRADEGIGYYVPVSTALGLSCLERPILKILQYDPELRQRVVEVRFENATIAGIKIGIETREVGYLIE
jgi:hypothetical protein